MNGLFAVQLVVLQGREEKLQTKLNENLEREGRREGEKERNV